MTLRRRGSTWAAAAALALSLFALVMSALLGASVFDRLPHLEDEVAYLYQARIFAGGHLVADTPEPSSAFWQPFVVRFAGTGKSFGKYPPGWPALLAVAVGLRQPWLANAILAALVVALVYALGREVYGQDTGILAALLTAFSPAALLLNATLMAHTAALFLTSLFVYSFWRTRRCPRPGKWAVLAGLSLGALAATRPLTAVAVALPFAVWSAARLLRLYRDGWREGGAGLSPRAEAWSRAAPWGRSLLSVTLLAAVISASVPAWSYVATGDAGTNLYTLVWPYDRVGFGPDHGRSGHSLEKGYRHAGFDLRLAAADLFGWQPAAIDHRLEEHFVRGATAYPGRGLSFWLLPAGALAGLLGLGRAASKRVTLAWLPLWGGVALAWALLPRHLDTELPVVGSPRELLGLPPDLLSRVDFSWLWVVSALAWLYLPLLLLTREYDQERALTWLLGSVMLGLVVLHITYWVGAQRYSARYYFEALGAAATLSALAPAGLIAAASRRGGRLPGAVRAAVHGAFALLCVATLPHYSLKRIGALRGYNHIDRSLVEQVDAARRDQRPVLAVVSGPTSGDEAVHWYAYGALLAVTSPYLDSEIVAARDTGGMRAELLARFPGRQVIDVRASGADAWVESAVEVGAPP